MVSLHMKPFLEPVNNIDQNCFRSYLQSNCERNSSDKSKYKYEANEIGGNCYTSGKSKEVSCYMDYEVTCDTYKSKKSANSGIGIFNNL